MGAGTSTLQGEEMGEELEMFLGGEEMSEEQVMSLLDFKIRPVKSWEEEKSFHDACLAPGASLRSCAATAKVLRGDW